MQYLVGRFPGVESSGQIPWGRVLSGSQISEIECSWQISSGCDVVETGIKQLFDGTNPHG